MLFSPFTSDLNESNIFRISVYPNPIENELFIEGQHINSIQAIHINDLNGSRLLTYDVTDLLSPVSMDLTHLKKGISASSRK